VPPASWQREKDAQDVNHPHDGQYERADTVICAAHPNIVVRHVHHGLQSPHHNKNPRQQTQEHTGAPKIQLHGPSGIIAEKSIGEFPPLACKHFLLSELFPGLQTEPEHPVTVRMLDENAMMVVSAVHLDYDRRDLALEHGSDRHSTFNDFKC
jgi:hypothetical protein